MNIVKLIQIKASSILSWNKTGSLGSRPISWYRFFWLGKGDIVPGASKEILYKQAHHL